MVWNLFPFKGDLCFGKSQKFTGHQVWVVVRLNPWVICCFTKKLCTRRGAWMGTLSWWSWQSPVDQSCGLLSHLNSFCGGIFTFNAKSDADSLLYLLRHFECNGHTVHMLIQQHLLPPLTTTVKSSLFTHEHSSPLSLAVRYNDVTQTILAILTMPGLFLDRTHMPWKDTIEIHNSQTFSIQPINLNFCFLCGNNINIKGRIGDI